MLLPMTAVSGLLLAIWGSKVDLRDFITLITAKIPEGTPAPSIPCMMTRCGYQTFQCLTDEMCLKALACVAPCGSDQACTFHCISNYETPKFHSLNKCIIHDEGCVVLKPPEVEDECGNGSEEDPLEVLPLESIKGLWFIVMGENPVYDCFPCQIFTFDKEGGVKDRVVMDYQVDRDVGDTVQKRVIMYIQQPHTDKQGQLALSGIQNGLYHEEEWRVLARHGEWILASYCGSMTSWTYRGMVVFARSPGTSEDMITWLNESGHSSDKFCTPKSLGCDTSNLGQ